MRFPQIFQCGMMCALIVWSPIALAETIRSFDCQDSRIQGSIKYGVIGSYNFLFNDCRGEILYDEVNNQIKHVRMVIQAGGFSSNCLWCDKIVRSKKLLDVEQYPTIVFEGDSSLQDETPLAIGLLDLHGVKKSFSAPFEVQTDQAGTTLMVKGVWHIRRKDFDITWNRLLDHGGVLVGEDIKIDWNIKAKPILVMGDKI